MRRERRAICLLFLLATTAALDNADDDSAEVSHSVRQTTVAPVHEQLAPVDATYPHISQVSGFLAAKFESSHLTRASLSATNFVMVAALAQRTTADIVSRQEARMPFGGFDLPEEQQSYKRGRLYIMCGLVEINWVSNAERKVNPWPEWRMLCGKVFRADSGRSFLVRQLAPPRTDEDLAGAPGRAVVAAAVRGLSQLPRYQRAGTVHKLVAVLSLERQTMGERDFRRLALSKIPGDIDLFYVAFLTSDDPFGSKAPVPHVSAVMRSAKTGLKVVRQISLGESGFTVVRGAAGIRGLPIFSFDAKMQAYFQVAVAKAVAHDTQPSDVEITSVDVLSSAAGVTPVDVGAGAAAVGAGATPPDRRLRRRLVSAPVPSCEGYSAPSTRLASQAAATKADLQLMVTSGRRLSAHAAAHAGTKVMFTLSVPGSAGDVLATMRAPEFIAALVSGLQQQGVTGVKTSDVTFMLSVLVSNQAVAVDAGLSLRQLVILISAFVLGVLLTTLRAAHLRLRRQQ
eukprot:g769.t1